jgi:hypothetical protein
MLGKILFVGKVYLSRLQIEHIQRNYTGTLGHERYHSLQVRHVDIETKCQMILKVLFLLLLKDKLNTIGLLKMKNM